MQNLTTEDKKRAEIMGKVIQNMFLETATEEGIQFVDALESGKLYYQDAKGELVRVQNYGYTVLAWIDTTHKGKKWGDLQTGLDELETDGASFFCGITR